MHTHMVNDMLEVETQQSLRPGETIQSVFLQNLIFLVKN